jgi:dihydropteroate synthase
LTPRKRYIISLPDGRSLHLGERTLVMGILNITPDSFADGGLRLDAGRAVDDGFRMLDAGADLLDVGGESTRPGAEPVPQDEELRRVLPVIERLAARGAIVSVDTSKATVAREAVARGALIVNDVTGLQGDGQMAAAVAACRAALVVMHSRGPSRDMYERAQYDDVARELVDELGAAVTRAVAAGVNREAVIIDPGIGFAKKPSHSYAALASLDALVALDRPILTGPSRKSFLKQALGDVPPAARDWGTAAAVAASILLGAHIVRVHAVQEMAQVVRVTDQVRAARSV